MMRKTPRRGSLAFAVVGLTTSLVLPLYTSGAALAAADPSTTSPTMSLPATVSADALPTTQINGVAWSQVVVGNRVYVTGDFTSARPAGSPAGTNETARSNILAYDLTTGNLISSWAPSLNGTGLAITASPDGSRIYVGGSFTSVNGVARNRIVALDATTGDVIPGFAPSFSNTVRALTTVGNTVYAGGSFTSVTGKARLRLAAVNASDGTLLSWAPTADQDVFAMTAPSSVAEIVVGGRFTTLNGVSAIGSGAVDATTGATLPWAVQAQFNASGPTAAIWSLTTDGTAVYATAYAWGTTGADLENSFAAEAAGGTLRWVNGCLGDTYSSFPMGGVLYTAGHAHDCSALAGGKPDGTPRTYQYAQATSTAALGQVNGPSAYGFPIQGVAAPTLLHWEPTFTPGSYTGQTQAVWSLAGNSKYIVAGGEFPTVNGSSQQGLTRFAVRSVAPNTQGPQGVSTLTPTEISVYSGRVRADFTAAWDRDDDSLTYDLLRGTGSNLTVVASVQASSQWWNRKQLSLVDTTAPAGTKQTYRIRATDPSGNTVTSASSTITVSASTSAYAKLIQSDGASSYWRLNETTGSTAGVDALGDSDLTVDAVEARAQAGATPDGDTATGFAGVTQTPVDPASPTGTQRPVIPASSTAAAPAPETVSIEAWIKTTTTSGGKIVGYGSSSTGDSTAYDRQIYMTNDGHLILGDFNGSLQTVTSAGSYNDGQWHHVVGTIGSGAGSLYVDGVRVGRQKSNFTGQTFSGFWRVGGDNLNGWLNQPSSSAFAGTIDDVAIYPTVLTAQQVTAHYSASGRTPAASATPSDPYGKAVVDSTPDSYWRLEDAAGSTTVTDSSGNFAGATVQGGATLGANGVQGGNGISLNGTDAGLSTTTALDGPTTYSEELWFNTTTTSGGKLVGFGSNQSGNSGSYDRHVYMQNDGKLTFGTYTGQINVATSSSSYNDGQWHHMVATQSSDGMKLFVDGQLVASNAQTQAQNYSGYWRVGGDNLGSWPNQPSSNYFAGTIDDVSIYSSALSADAVAAHFHAGGGNIPPVASFTATPSATDLSVALDAGASTDPDGKITSYAWDFGDGTTDTGRTTSHTFSATGTYPVTLTVKDDAGKTTVSTQQVKITAPRPAAPTDAYGKAVYAANPDLYWRLEEGSGATAANSSQTGTQTGTYLNNPTQGAAGIRNGKAVTLDGQDDLIVSSTPVDNPTTYSEELWFNTTTTSGGKLIGFGSASSGESEHDDRHVWMLNDGTLDFGVWIGQTNVISSSSGYNDGAWHHVVATQGSDGMKLYVDGALVASNGQTRAEAYTGYWRVGGDHTWGGASSDFFAGTIDEVAVYPSVLNAATVADHFIKGSPAPANQAPTASFTATTTNLTTTFDGSASTDPDGTIASYAWDFGDGTTGTGAKPNHTYTTAGTYTAKLTVTDNSGATSTAATKTITTTAPAPVNQAPTASFTATTTNLTTTFDGTASTDPDGTIASYAWDFGDGTTGTGTKPNHTYTTAGTYTAKLTVTDNSGATSTTATKTITTTAPAPVNQAPTASFTATTTNLTTTFDGTASTDPDGTIASYAWNFGDGTTGTGTKPNHTYTTAGTYTATLTVTDNSGATSTTATKTITTTAPAPAPVTKVAQDAFGRTTATGLGNADLGGVWSVTGSASNYSVSGGAAQLKMTAAGSTSAGYLNSVSSAATDAQVTFSLDKAPTGGGVYVSLTGRRVGTNEYRAKAQVTSTGLLNLSLVRYLGGTETTLKQVTISGVTVAAGQSVHLRIQVSGTGTTTLAGTAWLDGAAQPTAPQVTATDTSTDLQSAGGIGILAYQSGSSTNSPVTASFRNLIATTM